jgi:predicted DCC family thiol-disulfide oxidoreductase YuxK
MPASPSNPIILYDGVCGLCNRLVQFVLKHDSQDHFRFAALQSDFAIGILLRHGVAPSQTKEDLDTMYVVLEHTLPAERLASRSEAAVVVFRELGGVWAAPGAILKVLPASLRNWAYNLVARNRYRLFGKHDSCPIPKPKDRHKFLDLQ